MLNLSLIPAHLDVVIGDHYFELKFKVEKMGVDEHGVEVEVDWSPDADGEGEEDGEREDLEPKQMNHDLRRESKRAKNSALSETSTDKNGSGFKEQTIEAPVPNQSALKDIIQNMAEGEFVTFLKKRQGRS